ncbi:hypothetical protein [Spiroplasma endosymbiont of Nebria brevicollis]|uniref:hypothetical protein n=1 Tax=Spiroplasma endosymbiont of Nebria brevicollis TaxID=3066284 RepID=UPI00313BBA4B
MKKLKNQAVENFNLYNINWFITDILDWNGQKEKWYVKANKEMYVDEEKYTTIYKLWLHIKKTNDKFSKFSVTKAQLEDCFTFFKNKAIKFKVRNLEDRKSIEKWKINESITNLNIKNSEIEIKQENLNKEIINLNKNILDLKKQKFKKFKNILLKIITFGFYDKNKKINAKINQIEKLKEKINIDINKYVINFDNNSRIISKKNEFKIISEKQYDNKIVLLANTILDFEKILELIQAEKENIVSNKISRKESLDSGISDGYEECIDVLEYFKEKEINSLDYRNKPSTSGYDKVSTSNSPRM